MEVRAGFVRPDFGPQSPLLDLEAQKRLVPAGATVKGMQLQAIVDDCVKRGASLGPRRYVAFRDYPGEALLELLVLATERAFPNLPPREALRRIGRVAYPTLKSSLVGRVIFGAFGADVESVWKLVSKGYAISGSVGSVNVLELGPTEVVLLFEGIYSFIDSWHVGIMEGAVEVYGAVPTVLVNKLSPTSAEMSIAWIKP